MRYLFCCLFTIIATCIFAQQVQVAYVIHNLNQPGITISAPHLWTHKIKEKEKKKGVKQIGKSNIILPQFTYYNHIRKENNFTLGCEIVRQRHRMKPANWKFETGLGLHYVRSFNAGKTYKVQDGEVKRIRFAGQNYLAPSLSYSLGRDFFKKRTTPISTFIKPQTFLLMPYNGSVVPSVNIQLGLILHLNKNSNA